MSELPPLPERDPSHPAEQQGIFRKFEVYRTDRSDAGPGCKHYGCDYFVLDTTHDQHAKAALSAYADAVEATHPQLAADMRARYALAAAESVGCACRWDKDDNRVQTCERHQGWLDVVHEWAERAKAAERQLASAPTEPMSAPTAEPVGRIHTLVTGCHECPSCVYESSGRYSCERAGYRTFGSDGKSSAPPEWCPLPLYATPPGAATPEPSDAEREALRFAEMSMAAMRDALMPSFEYVGVSLRVSQEDHAAIRSALASMSTALHMVRAAIRATKGGKL